ncbi:MAG: glycosyltransferase family 2 protein [Plesiomonas sp.]
MKLSGLVITFNEEKNILACLHSLQQVCDDIVVVDSGSTDRTCELALEAGATVIVSTPFLGDGPQRSYGLASCRHDWVVNLDADERLDDDLVAYLRSTDIESLGVEAIENRRKNYIGQRMTKYAGQYPDYICRIFNRTKTDFSPVFTHTRIMTRNTQKINQHVIHYSYADYHDMFARCVKYGQWQGKTLAASGKSIKPWHPIVHGVWTFIRLYIIKQGFLAGLDGFTIAKAKAVSSYLKYAVAWELQGIHHDE